MNSTKGKRWNFLNWLSMLKPGKNSLLFVMVAASFMLIFYSSVVYYSATNRVMEGYITRFAVNGLVATLGTAYPSVQARLDNGDSLPEILDTIKVPPSEEANILNFTPFITTSDNQIVDGSRLPGTLLPGIESLLQRNSFAQQPFPLSDELADVYIFKVDRGIVLLAISPEMKSGLRIGLMRDITFLVSFALRIEQAMVGSLVMAYAVFLILLILVLRIITRPLKNLTAAAKRYAKGDFDHVVKIPTAVSEMEVLADAFNHMGSELKRQHESLEAYSNELFEANCKVSAALTKLSIRNREQRAMIESSLKANKLATPNDVIKLMMERLREDLDLEGLACFIENENGEIVPMAYPWLPAVNTDSISDLQWHEIRTCLDTLDIRYLPASSNSDDDMDPENVSERLYIPLSNKLGQLGILELTSAKGSIFDPEMQQFCLHFVSHLEVIIRNKALYQETIRRSHELERINQISQSISGELDMEPLIRDVVEYTQNTINAECAFVGLIENSRLRIMHINTCAVKFESGAVKIDKNKILSEVVDSGHPLLINDFEEYCAFRANLNDAFIETNNFNSFIGCPILNKDRVIGIICGFSRFKNAFTSNDTYFLGLLASQVAIALDNASLFDEIRSRDQRRDYQLAVAQKLQASRIPTFFKQNVAAVNCILQPADELAGDFCDVFSMGRHSIAIVVGDVANKGVAASLMTFSLLSMFRDVAKTLKPPCEILDSINRSVIGQVKEDGWFATAFYGKLNTSTGTFTFSSAGHEQPIWYHADTGKVELLDVEGYPLGLFKCFSYETREITLNKGDRIVFYTDGITDAADENGQRFGHERLLQYISSSGHLFGEEFNASLIASVEKFTGGNK
ncbi:MAG: SpoIIE family protein phosphatase, partial [bacterium]|nr:SpoIIE family protein phosphatase [bacterium]